MGDPLSTVIGASASAVAAVMVWVITSRKRDGAEGAGFVADAAQAITESAIALVAHQQEEVHDCKEQLDLVRAEVAELRALVEKEARRADPPRDPRHSGEAGSTD